MGDAIAVYVKSNEEYDSGVYLYSHWGFNRAMYDLQRALKYRLRWNDGPYLARMIFDQMILGSNYPDSGFGISSYRPGEAVFWFSVNVDEETISTMVGDNPEPGQTWAFEEFLALKLTGTFADYQTEKESLSEVLDIPEDSPAYPYRDIIVESCMTGTSYPWPGPEDVTGWYRLANRKCVGIIDEDGSLVVYNGWPGALLQEADGTKRYINV